MIARLISPAALAVVAGALAACTPTRPMTTPWPALDDKLLADTAATFGFRLGVPTALAVTRDGAVLFRRTPPRAFEADLFELTTQGEVRTLATAADLLGTTTDALSDAERARRERSRTVTRGIVDIDVSDDGQRVLVPLGGVFHLLDRGTGKRVIVDPQGEAYDPHLAPDGSAISFVRGGDLWLVAPGQTPRQLTRHPEGFEYGVAEFVAQEELARRRGYWWSPDSKAIAFQRTDLRPVETIYVADVRHPTKPPVPFRYPRAGTANAIVDLGVVTLGTAEPRWLTWDLAKHSYLAAADWSPRGQLTALVMDRDQTEAVLLAFDPATGSARQLLSERDESWINVNAGAPRWLPDGSGFLWMTEAQGSWVLQLRSPDGALVRELTKPTLGLRHLSGIAGEFAIVEASNDAPFQEVWQVPLAGGEPRKLSTNRGQADVVRAKHGTVVIDTFLEAGGRAVVAVDAVRASSHELPMVAEQPALVPTTVLEAVDIDGRTHQVAITRPRQFERGRRYPVMLKVYGGPHRATVTAARDSYVLDQWYADAGFIVVRSDNRGTPNRGRVWERAVLRDLLTVPLDDQVRALQAVGARHPELDLGRVGIAGWSFGGYLSTMAVLLRPDVFKAGIAGAPVTDWALYDTAYTERYMKTPAANPDGYRATSALTHAAKLARPLLVMHGITDDNVHFAHTLALIEALYVAGKRAEVVTLSATHMVPDPKLIRAREQIQIDFLRQHLGPP